jgi:hypothetical protein
MRSKLLLTILLVLILQVSFAQKTSKWDKWNWLLGEWAGEGSGKPGQGSGTFSLQPDLDNNVLIRKNHSVYPASNDKPAIIHDDLMIVYTDFSGNPSKAIYFDNEGHTINYNIAATDNAVIMTSDKIPNVPVFRLSYILLEKGSINVKFEMSRDGETFTTYTEGKCKRL